MSDPFSLAASVASLTSLAIELIKILKTYASDAKSAPTDISQLLKDVEALSAVLHQFQSFLLDKDIDQKSFKETSALGSIIEICKTKLENLDQKLKKKYPDKKVVQGLVANDNDQKRSFARCKTKSKKLCQKVIKSFTEKGEPGLIDRLQWPFDKQECEDTITALGRFIQIFSFSLDISNWYARSTLYLHRIKIYTTIRFRP